MALRQKRGVAFLTAPSRKGAFRSRRLWEVPAGDGQTVVGACALSRSRAWRNAGHSFCGLAYRQIGTGKAG
jgi:hypothetical protein